jgi:uncharacterized protein (DUF433 family)
MALAISSDPVPLRVEPDGTIRVGDSRVVLDLVIRCFLEGWTAEEIATQYDTLDLGDVYFALGYYLRHKDEIDQYIQERRQQAEELRAEIEAWQESRGFDRAGLRARLLARVEDKSGKSEA